MCTFTSVRFKQCGSSYVYMVDDILVYSSIFFFFIFTIGNFFVSASRQFIFLNIFSQKIRNYANISVFSSCNNINRLNIMKKLFLFII